MGFPKSLVLSGLLVGLLCGASSAQWYDDFKPLADIYAKLDDLATTYPNVVEKFTIGQSWEGRDIRGIKISGSGGRRAVRPGVLLNGTQHAREWVSPMANMYAAEQLLQQYSTSGSIQQMLDQVDFYVIPVVNPDGYEYTWIDPADPKYRLWRKNRRPNGSTGTVGVDLNRNWDFGWGLNSGSSSRPSGSTYRGPAPFSEPETAALRDFYYANQNLVTNIDFHNYSQLVLYPFGYTETEDAPDRDLLAGLAAELASSIFDVHGVVYEPAPESDLYLASGLSIDWSYGDQNVYSYTIELRSETSSPGFELPASEIVPTAEEAFAAVLEIGHFTANLAAGDFDNNGHFNCGDLDALYGAILNGTHKYEFDVSGDGVVDAADVPAWLTSASASSGPTYLPGDANLDGWVNTEDLNIWRQHRFTQTDSFCEADFNADGATDLHDFDIWDEYQRQSAALPEPTAWMLFGTG